MSQLVEREEAQVKAAFGRVDTVEKVALDIAGSRPDAAGLLRAVAMEALKALEPIRVSIAATLLAVSTRTVKNWADEGLLRAVAEHPRRLDPVRLHQVVRLVTELREAGKNRDLLNAVWYRLQDEAMLEDDDLAESLAELRRGETVPAHTRAEELAQHH